MFNNRRYANKAFLEALNNSADSYDHADMPIIPGTMNDPAKLLDAKGNPNFSAVFNLTFLLQYFTESGGTYTSIAESALHASLRTQLPFFVFGFNDYASGFPNMRRYYELSVWAYGRPLIFGKDDFSAYDATAIAGLRIGDLVIPFTATVSATNYVAFSVLRCSNVAYGSLLDSLSSDRFILNRIRYFLPDTSLTAQYSNDIGTYKLSLFGKAAVDFTTPNDFKNPDQQQDGIVDINILFPVDKHKALAMFVNTAVVTSSWSVFVQTVDKLSA